MVNLLIWGIGGRLGKMVLECSEKTTGITCVGGVDAFLDASKLSIPLFKSAKEINVFPNLIIDFSRPEALESILEYATKNKIAAVLATTGYSEDDYKKIEAASKKTAIFQASNMSIGINLLIDLSKKASKFLGNKFDIEIVEQHHNLKVDSPSGTALSIAKAIAGEFEQNEKSFVYGRHDKNFRREAKEIGIHAVRGGTVVGKHDVLFLGNDEVITLSHEAQSKNVFAEGAIKAGMFIAGKKPNLYNMADLLNS